MKSANFASTFELRIIATFSASMLPRLFGWVTGPGGTLKRDDRIRPAHILGVWEIFDTQSSHEPVGTLYIKHHLMVRALYKTPFNGARII